MRILFLVRIYTAAREVKRVIDRGRWRGVEREFFPLPSSPPLPFPPFPIIFWFNLGSGFRTAVSLTLRTTKEEAPTPKKPARWLLERCGWINLYLVDNAIDFPHSYPLDSDLSGG